MSFTDSTVIQRVNTGQGSVSTDLLSCFIRGLDGLQYIGTGALHISTNTPDGAEPGELVLVFSSQWTGFDINLREVTNAHWTLGVIQHQLWLYFQILV